MRTMGGLHDPHHKRDQQEGVAMDYNIAQDNGPFSDAPFSWEEIARALYALLDDCDTADDIAKGNDQMFRSLVRKAHKERFRFGVTDGYSVSFNVQEAN